MSKTLVGILETVALVGAYVFLGPIGAAGVALTESVLNATVLRPSAPTPPTTETAVKTAIPERVSAYGRRKLFGAYILFVTNAAGTAIDVYAFHDGEMDGAEIFYLGDIPAISAPGIVEDRQDGAFSGGNVAVDYRRGQRTETAFYQVISLLGGAWTSQHRGDGVVTGMVTWNPVKSADYTKVYPNGQPALAIAGRWQQVFDWRDSSQSVGDPTTWKWSENACLHLAHYILVRQAVGPMWPPSSPYYAADLGAMYDARWASLFAPTLAYWTAAANDCDVAMLVLGGQSAVAADDQADSDSRILLTTVYNLTTGTVITITDASDSSHVETRTVTSIVPGRGGYLVGLDHEISANFPVGSSVTWVSTTAHPLTEPRYRSCVAHKHTDAHKDVITALLGCFDGWLSPRADGALMVFSGRLSTPTVSIGPEEIVSYSVQDGVDEENAVNSIAINYVSAAHAFNTVDCDAWTDEDDIAARGKVLSQQLANQVPSFTQARRLAKRQMARIMAPQRVTITTNAAGRIVRGQRYVNVDLTEAGTTFLSGTVEVTKLTRNIATGGVTFEGVIVDPNVDSWNPVAEEGLPAPIGNMVAAEPLPEPTISSVTNTYGQNATYGTPGVKLTIVATAGGRTDATWYVRTRPVGSTSWLTQNYPDVDPGTSVTLVTDFLPLADLEVEVAYTAGDGRLSPWASPGSVDTSTVLPSALMNLSVDTNSDNSLIVIDWSASTFATGYLVEVMPNG